MPGSTSCTRASPVSPYEHVKRGHPPTIIFHGEDDTTVPIQSARDYAAKVGSVGGDCTVVGFPGQKHAFFNQEPFVWETLKQAEAFLEKHALFSINSQVSAAQGSSR
ncbi:MAG: alpha/beta hydrolase [Opitutaceae bacterium]